MFTFSLKHMRDYATVVMFHVTSRRLDFGYISGVNVMTEQTWKSPADEKSIWLPVMEYCKESPFDQLFEATVETYSEIIEKEAILMSL